MNDLAVLHRERPLRTAADLAESGLIPADRRAAVEQIAARYAIAISPDMAGLIDAGDPADPIAAQFVPDARELEKMPEELSDPIGDDVHRVTEGLVHRYPDRVLLKLVHVCPVYCRFCFRRETVGPDGGGGLSARALDDAIAYIAEHRQIWEVIVSGGDPLIASPRRLNDLATRLAPIGHVKVVRFHTRVPVVAPERVTGELVAALKSHGKASYVAIHANHPREFTDAAREAIGRLADSGIALVSQSVLLKGVNDEPETLGALMRAFVECRVKPYYLHHADPAPGTSRFRTTIAEGQGLMLALRGRYSGLCQPTYVIDIPGGYGKVPLTPRYLCDGCEDRVRDPDGVPRPIRYRSNRVPHGGLLMVAPGGILVFGAGGLVGRAIISAKAPSGLNVVGLRHAEADITDAAAVERIVAQVRPAVIVNAAGYAAVDRAESEPDLAFAVNADGAGNLAAAARGVGASLVHLSTDYVFDGAKRSPYREDHPTSPINAYGQSKAAGERAVREATDRHVIVRTAWLYGRHGKSFVSTMLKFAADRDDVNVVDDQRGTPTSAADLSDAILAIAARLAAGGAEYGTFHFTNAGETTWHGLAGRIFAELSRRGLKAPRLNAIPTSAYPTQARRPAYSVLDCTRIGRAYGIVPRPWEAALDDELAAMIDGAGMV